MTDRCRDCCAAASAGVVALVLALVMLRHGLPFGPDAWAHWSASVSLLEGRGYVDAHGLPVVDWPPGYPLWLAAVQGACGVSVASVRLGDCLGAALLASLLCAWVLRRTAAAGGPRWPVACLAVAATLLALRGGSAEHLMLAMLFLMLLALDAWVLARGRAAATAAVAVAALAAAAMVGVRHAALAFVPAGLVMVGSVRAKPSWQRALVAAAIAAAAAATWFAVRQVLAQHGRHPLGSSDREPWPTVLTMVRGLDRELAPFALGMMLFVVLVLAFGPWRERVAAALRVPAPLLRHGDVVAFVLVGLGGVFAMFLLVHVADPPGGRFVRFASLMLGGLAVGIVRGSPRARWRLALLVLLLLPKTIQAGKEVVLGRSGRNSVSAEGGEVFLPPNATLQAGVAPGTVLPDGRVVVAMPLFRWLEQRLGRGEGR